MGDDLELPAAAAAADAEAPAKHLQHLITISETGDTILAVTFLTSPATLDRARKASGRAENDDASSSSVLTPKLTLPYRVSLAALTKHSHYFGNLLTNPSFQEAQLVSSTHAALTARGIHPGAADAAHLPWVSVTDDDEATQSASRQAAVEDMLRTMHGLPLRRTPAVMSHVLTLAITADRFDGAAVVARGLAGLKFRWPVTSTRPYVDEGGRTTDVEGLLRQKILLAWLLNQPVRMHRESRELIVRGSRLWGVFAAQEGDLSLGAWWHLPEGIEQELHHRRSCILNTIASVQRHFLARYSSRHRQCTLGYDSSAACDSFQLGQMLKFLLARDLVRLADFSPSSVDALGDVAAVDIDEVLAALKQCPNYQVDRHHLNCGLRIRIDPIVDYVKAMLGASVVSLPLVDWRRRRGEVSWVRGRSPGRGEGESVFAFTRALASDERLRFEGAMYVDGMARTLFTAGGWDWTPEG